MEMNFKDLEISDNLLVFSNGQEVLDNIESLLLTLDAKEVTQESIQPISLLLLDINMPIMNGFEVLPLAKEKFRLLNEKRQKQFEESTQ